MTPHPALQDTAGAPVVELHHAGRCCAGRDGWSARPCEAVCSRKRQRPFGGIGACGVYDTNAV